VPKFPAAKLDVGDTVLGVRVNQSSFGEIEGVEGDIQGWTSGFGAARAVDRSRRLGYDMPRNVEEVKSNDRDKCQAR
jgi:hypothetical protein